MRMRLLHRMYDCSSAQSVRSVFDDYGYLCSIHICIQPSNADRNTTWQMMVTRMKVQVIQCASNAMMAFPSAHYPEFTFSSSFVQVG